MHVSEVPLKNSKSGWYEKENEKEKGPPGGHFCVTEKYSCLSNLYMLLVYLAESSCVLEDPQDKI